MPDSSFRHTRRSVLALLAGGASLGVLATCGESEPQAQAELRQDLDEALERARAVATTSVERAPGAGGMPRPGDRRRVTVLFPSSGWGGGPENRDLEPIMISARFSAAAETENRYDFESKSLPSKIDSRWNFADVLEGFNAAGGPVLVMLDVADLRGLTDAERLLPLNDYLASDSAFDPPAYWPRVLETGQIDGAQYALPVAVAPWITILNADLARSSGIEPPAREGFDRGSLLKLALAMQGGPTVPGREHALGYHQFVDPPTTALPDVNAWPPLFAYVMSAVGQLRADDGSFDALRSTQALDAMQFMQDLRKVHGVEAAPERTGRRVWTTMNEGNLGMFGWSLRGGDEIWLRGPGRPENLLYPFPRMGAGGGWRLGHARHPSRCSESGCGLPGPQRVHRIPVPDRQRARATHVCGRPASPLSLSPRRRGPDGRGPAGGRHLHHADPPASRASCAICWMGASCSTMSARARHWTKRCCNSTRSKPASRHTYAARPDYDGARQYLFWIWRGPRAPRTRQSPSPPGEVWREGSDNSLSLQRSDTG